MQHVNSWQFVAMVTQNCIISDFSSHHYNTFTCGEGYKTNYWKKNVIHIGRNEE
jgi:hypothetical protein